MVLRGKLAEDADSALADAVLNTIIIGNGVQVVVPSTMSLGHLKLNVAAVVHSRFDVQELQWLRSTIGSMSL